MWGIAAVLVLWAGIAALRSRETPGTRNPEPRTPDDEIDRAALEQAEREVRDLDASVKPEDGFEGDDWGPGASKPRS